MNNLTFPTTGTEKPDTEVYWNEFYTKVDLMTSVLTTDEISQLENLIEIVDFYSKHRYDLVYNTRMKIKLTPQHSNIVYMPNTEMPINLRD